MIIFQVKGRTDAHIVLHRKRTVSYRWGYQAGTTGEEGAEEETAEAAEAAGCTAGETVYGAGAGILF